MTAVPPVEETEEEEVVSSYFFQFLKYISSDDFLSSYCQL